MSLGGLIHRLRDSLLLAAQDLDRGDEDAAAEKLEQAARDIRDHVAKEKAA